MLEPSLDSPLGLFRSRLVLAGKREICPAARIQKSFELSNIRVVK